MAGPLRFSLAALIAAMALVGIYLAALRDATSLGAEAALTLTIGLLGAGLLWGIFHPRANRLFWLGFEICGWGYLLLACSAGSRAQLSTHLATTRLAAAIHGQMPLTRDQDVMVEWGRQWWPADVLRRDGVRHFIHYRGYGKEWDEWVGPERIRGQLGPFLQTCHSFFSLLLAMIGGAVTSSLAAATPSRRWFWAI